MYNVIMKTTPKDFFMQLGATILLYIAVGTLVDLAYSIINYAFPDQLAGYYVSSSMAWPIAVLVIVVPALYILEWFIRRDIRLAPEKASLPIRRWSIFLTLFLAIALVGGDFIALIYTYLSGEITARFVWKAVAIVLVVGTAGKYYFFSAYPGFRLATIARRANAIFGILLVGIAVIAGFVIVGSPATQRALRFDTERVNNLTNIQYQILGYWQREGKVPNTLAELNDSLVGNMLPTDPETERSYEYMPVSASTTLVVPPKGASFVLCATFGRASRNDKGRGAFGGGAYYARDMAYTTSYYPGGDMNDTWTHAAGRVCFDRAIDPKKHPVDTKPTPLMPI